MEVQNEQKVKLNTLIQNEKVLKHEVSLIEKKLDLYLHKFTKYTNKVTKQLEKISHYEFNIEQSEKKMEDINITYKVDEKLKDVQTYYYKNDDLEDHVDRILDNFIKEGIQNDELFELMVFYQDKWDKTVLDLDVVTAGDLQKMLASQYGLVESIVILQDEFNNFLLPQTDIRMFFQTFQTFKFQVDVYRIKLVLPINMNFQKLMLKKVDAITNHQRHQEDIFQVNDKKNLQKMKFVDKQMVFLARKQVKMQEKDLKLSQLKKYKAKKFFQNAIFVIILFVNIYFFSQVTTYSQRINEQYDINKVLFELFPDKEQIIANMTASADMVTQYDIVEDIFFGRVNITGGKEEPITDPNFNKWYKGDTTLKQLVALPIVRQYQYRCETQKCFQTTYKYYKVVFDKDFPDDVCPSVQLFESNGKPFDNSKLNQIQQVSTSTPFIFLGKAFHKNTYYYDLNLESREKWKESVAQALKEGWIDNFSRATSFQFVFYCAEYNMLAQINMFINKQQSFNFFADFSYEIVILDKEIVGYIVGLALTSLLVLFVTFYNLLIKQEINEIFDYLGVKMDLIRINEKWLIQKPQVFDILTAFVQISNLAVLGLEIDVLLHIDGLNVKDFDHTTRFLDMNNIISELQNNKTFTMILTVVNMLCFNNNLKDLSKLLKMQNKLLTIYLQQIIPVMFLMLVYIFTIGYFQYMIVGHNNEMYYTYEANRAKIFGITLFTSNFYMDYLGSQKNLEQAFGLFKNQQMLGSLFVIGAITFFLINTIYYNYMFILAANISGYTREEVEKEDVAKLQQEQEEEEDDDM